MAAEEEIPPIESVLTNGEATLTDKHWWNIVKIISKQSSALIKLAKEHGTKLDNIASSLKALAPAGIIPTAPTVRTRDIPISRLDRYAGGATTYQKVVEWIVAGDAVKARLDEISLITSNYGITQFKLDIEGKEQWTGEQIQAPFTAAMPVNELRSGSVVTLWARSTTGAAITVDGSITGFETYEEQI